MFGIFLVSFVSGADVYESDTSTSFNVRGCTFLDNTVGLARGECSSGIYEGLYFCGSNSEAWETFADEGNLGCAEGNPGFDGTNNTRGCCPNGYFCYEVVGFERFRCVQMTENCANQTKGDCKDNNNGCIWLEYGGDDKRGACVGSLENLPCSYYQEEDACIGDELNLGTRGIGTEDVCGTDIFCDETSFSIPVDNCTCKWYSGAAAGQECQLNIIGVQMFYTPNFDPKAFECSNSYVLGNCTEGVQTVEWFSNSSTLSGFAAGADVPDECLELLGCAGGATTRACGEPIIKLPGFSLFALFASLFIIGTYYFIRKEDLNKAVC